VRDCEVLIEESFQPLVQHGIRVGGHVGEGLVISEHMKFAFPDTVVNLFECENNGKTLSRIWWR
jgi:hypothetical protein